MCVIARRLSSPCHRCLCSAVPPPGAYSEAGHRANAAAHAATNAGPGPGSRAVAEPFSSTAAAALPVAPSAGAAAFPGHFASAAVTHAAVAVTAVALAARAPAAVAPAARALAALAGASSTPTAKNLCAPEPMSALLRQSRLTRLQATALLATSWINALARIALAHHLERSRFMNELLFAVLQPVRWCAALHR